ncbi:MAG: response regulator transcription factor [Treponema sp.]|nr:response regulator transcription factor [Treponema sp.]
MIKILIVEDQTILRDSLEHLINGQDDMKVIGGTDDAALAPGLCRKLQPDLVLMDVVTKNNSSGIRSTAEIRREFSKIKVVIMTGLPEITFAEEARKAGAHSYLYKNTEKDHLLYVIRSTMKGAGIYPGPADVTPFTGTFSEKEIAIIRMVCQGIERDEMAKKLEISESRIKQYITSILDKTGFDSISKFAIYAVSHGLVAPEIH